MDVWRVVEEIERFSMYISLRRWCVVNGDWVYVVSVIVLLMY